MAKTPNEANLGGSSRFTETDLRHGRDWLPQVIPDYYIPRDAVQPPLLDNSGRPYYTDDSLREAGLKGVRVARFALDHGPNSVPAPNDKL